MSENSFLKNLTADFVFSQAKDDKYDFYESDLVELKPFGLSLTNELAKPFMIFKDLKTEQLTLPVPLAPIEAGLTLAQSTTQNVPVAPHRFVEMLLGSLDIRIEKCIFMEIKGLNQYVRLFLVGHPKYNSMKVKATEALSLCIHLKVPFFATKEFIQKSKNMNVVPVQAAKTVEVASDAHALLASLVPHGYVH